MKKLILFKENTYLHIPYIYIYFYTLHYIIRGILQAEKNQGNINEMSEKVNANIAGSNEQQSHAAEEEEEDPDLEDGEIDDDDDDEAEVEPVVAVVAKEILQPSGGTDQSLSKSAKVVQSIDLAIESTTLPPSNKTKKTHVVEDDHASSIEQAIASALKKKGIEPPMPKLKEPRSDTDGVDNFGHGQSRSSRRRKRKRQRDELEKDKERKEKKRMKFDSTESAAQKALNMLAVPAVDDDEPDDYEMMNVRGGSPPPAGSVLLPTVLLPQKYDTDDDDSCNSYDSYVSQQQNRYESRRSNKSKESRKSRRERGRPREDRDERNSRSNEKRIRLDLQSEDSKHRQEPRKLELCKFYLMECCAKKDKCSYMHSDFPCKYYYLGMECVQGDQCKFSHGKPLTEQLRIILLKHLETAPKEILGAFKRICRDTAISHVATRHAELCKKFGIENKLPLLTTSGSSGSGRGASNDHHHHNQQHHQQQQQQQQQSQSQTHQQPVQQQQPQIPSLLDIIIKPPTIDDKPPPQKEKQRKSRWCDANSSNSINNNNNNNSKNSATANISTLSSSSGSLELKNLAGLVNATIIEKLSQVGVVNLEQVNQLRFGQLTKIGVTIADISELQIKAQSFIKSDNNLSLGTEKTREDKISTNRDVDMRFIPSGSNSNMPQPEVPESDMTMCSSSNSNSNSGVVLVDYSQYLKDSNLSFDRSELFDDEKDEQQLVIDYDLDAGEDAASVSEEQAEEENYKADIISRESPLDILHSKLHLKNDSPPKLTNPFTSYLYKQQDNDSKEQRDPRSKQSATTSVDSIISASFIGKFNPFRNTFEENKNRPDSPEAPVYERSSMYDYNPKYADEDKNSKTEKNKRLTNFSVPFQPAPATEIDASVTSHLPIQWKLYEIDVPRPSFGGHNFTSDQIIDPRVRRIIRLPELPKTNTAAALSRGRTPSTTIASPDSTECSSPAYYTPPSSSNAQSTATTANIYTPNDKDREKLFTNKPTASASRLDPRRAAAAAALSTSSTNKPTSTSVAQQQNIEIRNLLQKSEWYKNLNSTTKITVNQQLALVSTELKKYHQDTSTEKVFDTQFIVSNPTLQQILTSLGIYIDYNGEVSHIENDNENQTQSISGNILQNLNQMPPNMRQQVPFIQQQQQQQCISGNNMLPNLNQMPPNLHQVPFMQQQQMVFLRGPPPGMPSALNNMQFMPHASQHMSHMSAFGVGPTSNELSSLARPSLLGMPPVLPPIGNPFNQPFSNVLPCPGPSMMGSSSEFGNLRGGPGMQQQNIRNFNNPRHNRNQRQQNNNN